jgi:Recombination endonuclease VII
MLEKAGRWDAHNARRRERYAQDPVYRAKENARRSAHRQAHRPQNRERARRYREAHRDEINKRARARYHAHKDEGESPARKAQLRRYGISLAEYDALLEKQGGACAICRKRSKGRLCVDHCHVTGMVRGLLCNECNTALGYLKDDQASLVAALAYLGALPRDGPGSAAQRALAVHDVLPPWPTGRAILTCPPIRCDAAPRACGIDGRTSAERPTSLGGAVLPANSVHRPSEGDDMAIDDAPTTSPMRDALGAELARASEDGEGNKADVLQLIARKLATKALEGDLGAIKEIFDRIDGKTSPGASPVRTAGRKVLLSDDWRRRFPIPRDASGGLGGLGGAMLT